MIHQLGSPRANVPANLKDLYQSLKGHASNSPPEELLKTLSDIIASMKKVYLVVDAMVLLSYPSQRMLVQALFRLHGAEIVSFVATSSTATIFDHVTGHPPSIKMGSNEDDINACISYKLANLPGFIRSSLELQEEIRENVLRKSQRI